MENLRTFKPLENFVFCASCRLRPCNFAATGAPDCAIRIQRSLRKGTLYPHRDSLPPIGTAHATPDPVISDCSWGEAPQASLPGWSPTQY